MTEDQTNRLFKSICKFVSEPQEEELWERTFHFEKGKTDKSGVFYNIPVVNDANSEWFWEKDFSIGSSSEILQSRSQQLHFQSLQPVSF